jgi:protein tyrosine/serine phosphatase
MYRWFFVGALLGALSVGGCASAPRGVPASEGIGNFARVNDALWRGAQPDERGFDNLKRLGAATIVNLRMADEVWPEEAATVRRLGLNYVNVPLHGFSAPSAAEVARVLALIESSPPPVFVHCQHGADRTGTIIACYRIRREGWTAKQALAEARRFGLSGWEFGMKRFVREYARGGPVEK